METTNTIWTPHVTVAAMVERNGRYLMVRENTRHGVRINQPAGHWEAGETLDQAVCREVLEESGYVFTPTALLGVYVSDHVDKEITYLRFTFIGDVQEQQVSHELDDGIIEALWMSAAEIKASQSIHRNSIVQQCLLDYQAGKSLGLETVQDFRGLNS